MRGFVSMLALVGLVVSAVRGSVPDAPEEIVSNAGTYVVEWRAEPAEIPLSEPFALELEVRAADGGELPELELHFDARMPAHRHGMRRTPAIEALGGNRFRVEGALLHMPGTWELHLDLTRGAITERAQTRVELE